MCESKDCLHELFGERKKEAMLISKNIQNELPSCVRKYILSSGNACYLAHFFISPKKIKKNLYLETFYCIFDLLQKGVM